MHMPLGILLKMSQHQLALDLGVEFDSSKRQEKLFEKWKDKVTLPFSEIDISNPEHVALLNFQGMTFATIERIFGIPHTVAHKKTFPVTPGNRHFSLMNVVTREYLQNQKISKRDRDRIKKWVNANAKALLASKGKYYTRAQEDTIQEWESCDVNLDLIGGEDGETECF